MQRVVCISCYDMFDLCGGYVPEFVLYIGI